MGFNYNGKLRSAELLLREDGSVVEIRRAETHGRLLPRRWISRASRLSRPRGPEARGNEEEYDGAERNFTTRVARNPRFANLTAGYLFPEVARRRKAFQEKNPGVEVISLGIGNTTEPLSPRIAEGLRLGAQRLGTREGYSGYGDEQGMGELRARIAHRLYRCRIEPREVFVSDGAKCDIGRLQAMFGSGMSIAVQDPAYPVYVDGSVIVGAAGPASPEGSGYSGIRYLPCTPANGFFPDLAAASTVDLLYFCSPNNPTGACATRGQLEELVAFARRSGSIVIFDAAYAEYISDPALPKSIFEIEGARRGRDRGELLLQADRLHRGPPRLDRRARRAPLLRRHAGGQGLEPHDDHPLQRRLERGPGGRPRRPRATRASPRCAPRSPTTWATPPSSRAASIGSASRTTEAPTPPTSGRASPARAPGRPSSTSSQPAPIVTTPGSGFGPAGESFLRFSAFGHREDVEEAVLRLESKLG